MTRRLSLEAGIARLAEIERGVAGPAEIQELRDAFRTGRSPLAGRAARAALALRLDGLVPDLASAFRRFLEDPLRTDKGCVAKTAIVRALNGLEADCDDVFLLGARHVQLEPVYGGKADTAAEVRIQCGIALVRIGHPDALFELANHLADREVEVRRAAVKAVAAVGSESGGLLLRLKALTGDEDADVLAFAFSGLMAIAPERSLGFAASYLLSAGPEVAQGAALAIGGSATPEAFAALRRAWDQCLDAERKTMLLLPIALTRQDGAKEFLLGVVREEHQAKAEEAVAALKLFEADASLCGLLRDAVDERGDPVVEKAFLDEFGPLA